MADEPKGSGSTEGKEAYAEDEAVVRDALEEEGDDDSDDESGNLSSTFRSGLKCVNEHDEPGDDSGDTSEDERKQLSVAGLFVLLLQGTEHNHRCIDCEDSEERREV